MRYFYRLTSFRIVTLALLVLALALSASPASATAPNPNAGNNHPTHNVKIVPGSAYDMFYQGELAQIQKLEAKFSVNAGSFRSEQAYDAFLLRVSRLPNVRIRDFYRERAMTRSQSAAPY